MPAEPAEPLFAGSGLSPRPRVTRERFANARRGRLLLAVPICAWAISWPVMKIGIAEVPPIWFGCLRYFIATVFLAAILAIRGRLAVPSRPDWRLVLVSGALQMAAFSALTGLALRVLPAGRASILAYSTPMWVVPLSALLLNEPLSRKAVLGLAFGLAGIVLIAAPSLHPGYGGQLAGYAMLLGAAAAWATSILCVRGHRFHGTALDLAPWQMLIATLLLLPLAIWIEGPPPAIGARGAWALAYVGPFGTAVAYWAIVEAGRRLPASVVSMALLATPIVGTAISVLTLGEPITGTLILAMALIGSGIRLATAPSRARLPAAAGLASAGTGPLFAPCTVARGEPHEGQDAA